MIAGVDGTKNGWIVAFGKAGGEIQFKEFGTFSELLCVAYLEIIVADVPIGLLGTGTRLADQAARKCLGRRACCVFTAPIRPMLACNSYSQASDVRRRIDGKGCTQQLWAIFPKIREVDLLLRSNPALRNLVLEGHPEVSFTLMNNGKAVDEGKKSFSGRAIRKSLLEKQFGKVDALDSLPKSLEVDALDALAMYWSAMRVSTKDQSHLPTDPEIDEFGLVAQIIA